MTRKKFQRALLQQISRDWRYGRATWPTDFCQTILVKKGKKKTSIFAEILLLKQYFNTIKVKLNQIIHGRNFCLYFCTFYIFEYIDISNLFAVIFPIPIRILKFQSESFTCYKTLPIYLSKYNENFHNFRVTVAIWISDVSLFLQCRTNIYLFFNSISNLMAHVFFSPIFGEDTRPAFLVPRQCSFAILDTRVTTTEFRISVSAWNQRPTILSRKFTRRVVDLAWKHVSFPPAEQKATGQ